MNQRSVTFLYYIIIFFPLLALFGSKLEAQSTLDLIAGLSPSKAQICPGEEITVESSMAYSPSNGGTYFLWLEEMRYKMANCYYVCTIEKNVDVVVKGDGVTAVDYVRVGCNGYVSKIIIHAKPTTSTTYEVSWECKRTYDGGDQPACAAVETEVQLRKYKGTCDVTVANTNSPVILTKELVKNQFDASKKMTAAGIFNTPDRRFDWYLADCGNWNFIGSSYVKPNENTADFNIASSTLGTSEIKIRKSDGNCISDFSMAASIVNKPCRLPSSGCYADIVDYVEKNSCEGISPSRLDHHFYRLEKEICNNCSIEDVWTKYKSDVSNQAVILTDQTLGLLNEGLEYNMAFSKHIFPEEKYNTGIADCGIVHLPRLTSFLIKAGFATKAFAIKLAAEAGALIQSGCSRDGLSTVDPIFLKVDESAKCVTNYTLPGHILYPGKVTRCLVTECDKVKLLTFGEGTTEFPGNPLCGLMLSSANHWLGRDMFKHVDDRFYERFNSLNPHRDADLHKLQPQRNAHLEGSALLHKRWRIKTFQMKYSESDSLYELFSSRDTVNFLNFREFSIYFTDSGKYSGANTNGKLIEGTWALDSLNNKLRTDTNVVAYVAGDSNEFTLKGIVPVVQDTSLSEAQYYMTFVSYPGAETWIGTVSNSWEDPHNWSDGFVPDAFTDVIIKSGTNYNPVIHKNSAVKSLNVESSGVLKIQKGYNLNVGTAKN